MITIAPTQFEMCHTFAVTQGQRIKIPSTAMVELIRQQREGDQTDQSFRATAMPCRSICNALSFPIPTVLALASTFP